MANGGTKLIITCLLCGAPMTPMHVCAADAHDPRCKRMHVDGGRCRFLAGHPGVHLFDHGQPSGAQTTTTPLTFGMGIVGPVKVDVANALDARTAGGGGGSVTVPQCDQYTFGGGLGCARPRGHDGEHHHRVRSVDLQQIQDQARTRIAELEARIAKLESALSAERSLTIDLAIVAEHAFKVLAQLPTRDMSTEQQRAVRDAVHRIGPAVARALGRKWG